MRSMRCWRRTCSRRAPTAAIRGNARAAASGRLSLKLSKFGAFIGCSNYPECRYTRPLTAPGDGAAEIGTKKLGEDPKTGLDVTVRSGRFGPYVQLGEAVNGEKPKRASLPKGMAPEDIDLDRALALLSLPREVGRHPEDGEPIRAGIGRFGPYVQHGKTYANLESADDVFTIGLNRAVTLIAEKRAKGFRATPLRRRSGPRARRSSDQGRAGRCEKRPLRALCQPRRRQRDAAARQDARDHHARRGCRPPRGQGRARRSRPACAAAQGQARRAGCGATSQKTRQEAAATEPAKRPATAKSPRKTTQAAE